MSKIQLGIITFFGAIGIVAVLMFAGVIPGYEPGGGDKTAESVDLIVWGPFPKETVGAVFSELNLQNSGVFKIEYVQKNPETYESEFIEALASGNGPDIWFVNQESLIKNRDRIYEIPFGDNYTERDFKDTFVDSGEVFLNKQKNTIIAFPFLIDPLLLFWNRDIFSAAGVSDYSRDWNGFLNDARSLTKKDETGNVIQSGTAMGEFKNVKNAKGILSMLFLQGGNAIAAISGGKMASDLSSASEALSFFDGFSNTRKDIYSWNRALPDSDSHFANSRLAMYFGYAGEIGQIKQKNPHLNFDIAEVPQLKKGGIKTTHGKVYALAVTNKSLHKNEAIKAVFGMTDGDFSSKFSKAVGLGSSRRDVLKQTSSDPILSVVNKASVMARTWLEPDGTSVSDVFQNMIESTITGKSGIGEALKSAGDRLVYLFGKYSARVF